MQAPSAPSLLRKTAPSLCHWQRSQFCPCGAARTLYVVTPPDAPRAGRHLLRLSMCARHYVPNAHASLRICLPAHTARTLYVVTPPDAPRAGRYLLRLSMCARHYVPNAHASLREIPPCGAARRCASPPQNRSLSPPRQRSQFCPSGGRGFASGGTQLSFHAEIPGEGRLRALSGDRFCMPVSHAGFAKRRVSCRVPRRRRQC